MISDNCPSYTDFLRDPIVVDRIVLTCLVIRYQTDIPHNVLCCDSFGFNDMKKAYQLNAGLDFYQSGIKSIRNSMNILCTVLDITPSALFKLIGEILWGKKLMSYFRVCNSTPDDIPVNWRITDFLEIMKFIQCLRTLQPNTTSKLRHLLEQDLTRLSTCIKSGYYHAAI